MRIEELDENYISKPAERCEAGKELIETYWQSHNSHCVNCLGELIENIHLILANGGVTPFAEVEIIEAAQKPIDKSKAN